MNSCPACDKRLGPITLLLGVKYYRFACPHCGATLERNFDRTLWIIAVGAAASLGTAAFFAAGGLGWGSLKGLVVGPPLAVMLARLFCRLDIVDPAVLPPKRRKGLLGRHGRAA